MSIKKYTNIDEINRKASNEGQFLQKDDLFIVSKNEIETTEFGVCKYDVMEVSVYDINNNLLPQISGNNVAYIKNENIKNYIYQITNNVGIKELAINIEKLLNDLGFTNGILKTNINFVKYRIGSEDALERVWIQEISPSRAEIRIVPLKTKFEQINKKTTNQFTGLLKDHTEFKKIKKSILDGIYSFENNFLSKIDSALETKFGKDFFNTLKKDFGLSNFSNLKQKIFNDFKTSVDYYLNNKEYDITNSNFGKQSTIRFEGCDYYDFNIILSETQFILNNCVSVNLQSLKRRDVGIKNLPKEFAVIELQKQIQNNLNSFDTFTEKKRNVYSPAGVTTVFNDVTASVVTPPTIPQYPSAGTLLNTYCIAYNKYGKFADGNGGSYDGLIEQNSTECGYTTPTPAPSTGGGGGGGTYGGGGRTGNFEDNPYRTDYQK